MMANEFWLSDAQWAVSIASEEPSWGTPGR
jgi:hypothetical protein